jgi:hypothetical protein
MIKPGCYKVVKSFNYVSYDGPRIEEGEFLRIGLTADPHVVGHIWNGFTRERDETA